MVRWSRLVRSRSLGIKAQQEFWVDCLGAVTFQKNRLLLTRLFSGFQPARGLSKLRVNGHTLSGSQDSASGLGLNPLAKLVCILLLVSSQ